MHIGSIACIRPRSQEIFRLEKAGSRTLDNQITRKAVLESLYVGIAKERRRRHSSCSWVVHSNTVRKVWPLVDLQQEYNVEQWTELAGDEKVEDFPFHRGQVGCSDDVRRYLDDTPLFRWLQGKAQPGLTNFQALKVEKLEIGQLGHGRVIHVVLDGDCN